MLVAATIGAFFVTQHLKVTTPLIQGFPRPVPGVIDPLRGVPCIDGRNSGSTTISFYLQHRGDEVDVYAVDAEDNIVRTVATGRHMRKNIRNPDGVFHWDGRLDNGRVAPDGTYHFRVALIHQNRTIDLTAVPVQVKTVPPRPVVVSVSPSVIPTPAGSTSVTIRYAGNENRGGTILLLPDRSPGRASAPQDVPDAVGGPHRGVGREDPRAIRAPGVTYLLGIEVSDAACDTGRWPPRIAPTPAVMSRAGVTVQ